MNIKREREKTRDIPTNDRYNGRKDKSTTCTTYPRSQDAQPSLEKVLLDRVARQLVIERRFGYVLKDLNCLGVVL